MNYLDITILLITAFGLIRGFMKGFIYEIAVLGALFLGLYMAFHFADWLDPYILKVIDVNPLTLKYVSSGLMFIGVGIGIFFLAKLFEGLINIAAMGIFNKIAGAVFGGIKFLLVLSVILFFFNKVDSKYGWIPADKKNESRFYFSVMKIAPTIFPVISSLKEKYGTQLSPTKRYAEANYHN